MKTLSRLIVAFLLGVAPVLCLHLAITSWRYSKATSNPVLCFTKESETNGYWETRGRQVPDAPVHYPFGDPYAPRDTLMAPDPKTPEFVMLPDVLTHFDLEGHYWLYTSHWYSETDPTYYHGAAFMSGEKNDGIIVIGEGTLPAAQMNIRGNYSEWVRYDLLWLQSSGWFIYLIGGMAGVGIGFRRMLKHGAAHLHKSSNDAINTASAGLAKFDEKIEVLNSDKSGSC